MCFLEETYTALEDDGSITVCVEFSGALEITDPISVFIKTKDDSAEGMLIVNLLFLFRVAVLI